MRQLGFFLEAFHGSGLGGGDARLLNSSVVCAFSIELEEYEFRTVVCYWQICIPLSWQFLSISLTNHKNGGKKTKKKEKDKQFLICH